MRVLFDIVHPAHVHFFNHMMRLLVERGHDVSIVARNKDVTTRLLDQLGFPYRTVGRPAQGRVRQFLELVGRDLELVREIRQSRCDIVVTRNPAGVQAARIAGTFGIFDTDDGSAAGLHFHVARPFADVLTSPDCLDEDWGPRHVKYRGYKQLAYLHPNLFKPDAGALADAGLTSSERFFIVRFVAMTASHDSGEAGISLELKRRLIERLQREGRVLITSEGPLPEELAHLAYKGPPHRMLDLIAFASLVVGDSQTMAAEAAVLGTPSVRMSTWAGRLGYLDELEHRYRLTFGFKPGQAREFFAKLESLLAEGRGGVAAGHAQLLRDKVNVATWYVDLIEESLQVAERRSRGRWWRRKRVP